MKRLAPPNSHYLRTALGWIELGNLLEATAELEKIEPQLRAHPAVLKLRWSIAAAANKWEMGLAVASALAVEEAPNPEWHLNQALALHQLGRTQESFDLLAPLSNRFVQHAGLAYSLACYACRLGRLHECKSWLEQAFASDPGLRAYALKDPDLERFWKNIGTHSMNRTKV